MVALCASESLASPKPETYTAFHTSHAKHVYILTPTPGHGPPPVFHRLARTSVGSAGGSEPDSEEPPIGGSWRRTRGASVGRWLMGF